MTPLTLRLVLSAAFTALVLQFLVSGVAKLVNTKTCDDTKMLERVFGEHCPLNMVLLLAAGAFEILASLVVMGTTYFDEYIGLRRWALVALAAFTVLVTLLFKLRPYKHYGFMANVSVAGGLALAAFM